VALTNTNGTQLHNCPCKVRTVYITSRNQNLPEPVCVVYAPIKVRNLSSTKQDCQ